MGVDPLCWLLEDVRAEGALFGQTVMRPPWAVPFAGGAPLTMVLMVKGRGWVVDAEGHGAGPAPEPVELRVGDVAIVVGTAPFAVAAGPDGGPPAPTAAGGGTGGGATGVDLRAGVRTCDAPGDDGAAVVLSGSYRVAGQVSERLLAALPRLVVVRDEGELCPVMDLTFAEVGRAKPGQQVVLDRLLDLVLLTTLREWFDRPEAEPPSWYRAMGDPVAGAALQLLHGEPARAWTVASLAREVGVSRATLARRFAELVGETPMAYLTSWRLSLATDLLRRGDLTVDAVARRVGYASGYGLSVAFKRVLGTRPSDHRTAAA